MVFNENYLGGRGTVQLHESCAARADEEEHNASVQSGGYRIDFLLVHTGEHYDVNMSGPFFEDLKVPYPYIHPGVVSGTHAEQTGKVMMEFERFLLRERPDVLALVGNVNFTLACSLAAVKLHIPGAHVEGGSRSFDRSMPEGINRLVTYAFFIYLFTPSSDADENLFLKGIPWEKIYQVGDIMADSLFFHLEEAKESPVLVKLGLSKGSSSSPNSTVTYALLILHRLSNVDDQQSLQKILAVLELISQKIAIIYPIHPRTKKQLAIFHLQDAILFHNIEQGADLSVHGIHGLDPLGHLDFLSLMMSARFVLVDSGGTQEKTTIIGIPFLTLRDTTERLITISQGTNVLVWNDTEKIAKEAYKILEGKTKKAKIPAYWDGKTAGRIIEILVEKHFNERKKFKEDAV